jgi:hypothetical protein
MMVRRRLRMKEAILGDPGVCVECTGLCSLARGKGASDFLSTVS